MRLISAHAQNTVYNTLFDLMGTTSTGYGAVLLGDPVQANDLIRADNWDRLITDVERCLIHQTGAANHNMFVASTGTLVKAGTPDRMYTQLQFLQLTQGQVHPSQLDSMTVNTSDISPVQWTCTNYSNTATMVAGNGYMTTVNWSWFYENQVKYFFNLGGHITPEIRVAGARIQERAAWAPLIAAANNIVFGRAEYLSALSNPDKTYQFVVTGRGDYTPPAALRGWVKHISYKKYINKNTKNYSANALTVTFRVVGNQVIGTMNFVAGMGLKSKSKTKKQYTQNKYNKKHIIIGTKIIDVFTRTIVGKYIAVSVKLETDFRTVYPTGANGGIAAQIPQTQIIANRVSASPSPVPQFTMGVGDTSAPQVITLRNNSTLTCHVSDIQLSEYTDGTIHPTNFVIEPHRSADVTLTYNGTAAGHFKGLVDVLCDLNRLTLFTEVNVGSASPRSLTISTSTTATISQNFVIDHAGGYFKNFVSEFPLGNTPAGFTYDHLVDGTSDTFNITFNPIGVPNGTHSTYATITVNPMDSSLAPTVFTVPVSIDLNVTNRHIASWESAQLYNRTKVGVSYDTIDGVDYVTLGIGPNNPSVSSLGNHSNVFSDWQEVYRVPLLGAGRYHTKDYPMQVDTSFVYADYFGVGTARNSIATIDYDGKGNVSIIMNTLYKVPTNNRALEVKGAAGAFYYYDPTVSRVTQLQNLSGLTEGGQTHHFIGFDKHGDVMLSLVKPYA